MRCACISARLANDMLVGAMLSLSEADVGYRESSLGAANSGGYALSNLVLRPYFAWSDGATDVWGSFGFGRGEVELQDDSEAGMTRAADTSETSLAVAVKREWRGGLHWRADLAQVASSVERAADAGGVEMVAAQNVDSRRMRVLLGGERAANRGGRALSQNAEVGMRFDSAETDRHSVPQENSARENSTAGIEAALGVDLRTAGGLRISASARVYGGGDYSEWGIGGMLEKKAGAGGRGLSLRLRPAVGDARGNARGLWERSFAESMRVSAAAAGADCIPPRA